MLKFLNLGLKIGTPLKWICPINLKFHFQTVKLENNLNHNLWRPKQLSFTPQFFVAGRRKKNSQTLIKKWKIIKGDKVIVISGKDKGKQGIVYRVYRKQNKVLVNGINIVCFD